jgi:hypothetical protein
MIPAITAQRNMLAKEVGSTKVNKDIQLHSPLFFTCHENGVGHRLLMFTSSLVSRGLYRSSSPTVVTCCKFTYLNTFPRKSIIPESAISQQPFISFTTQQLVDKVPKFWIKKT